MCGCVHREDLERESSGKQQFIFENTISFITVNHTTIKNQDQLNTRRTIPM